MTEATDYREGDFADEPSAEVPTRVHIVAPSAMPEGYIFEAEVGAAGSKKTISAEVVSGCVLPCVVPAMFPSTCLIFEWFGSWSSHPPENSSSSRPKITLMGLLVVPKFTFNTAARRCH